MPGVGTWALDHHAIVGSRGTLKWTLVVLVCRGPSFEDGPDALANGSVRPPLCCRDKTARGFADN